MGKPITPATQDLAQDIVNRWLPHARIDAMTTGEAGLAPFKITADSDTFCLKVPIVTDDKAHMSRLTDSLAREAKLARWAGRLPQVAPPVCWLDAKTGSYATHFVPGRSPGTDEMVPLRQPIFSTLRRLHAADARDFPATDPKDDNWLLLRDVAHDLTQSAHPCDDAVCKDTLQLLHFVEDTAVRTQAPQMVIHNDLHKDNIIINGSDIRLIDMANLRLADPMVDVAHFCHELYAYDLSVRPSIATLASAYTSAAPRAGLADADANRIALHLARFDIRRQAFSREWSQGSELQDIVSANCRDLGEVFRERGFVTPKAFAG